MIVYVTCTAVAPELMQTHNIDMALSNGFEQMPQPALMGKLDDYISLYSH